MRRKIIKIETILKKVFSIIDKKKGEDIIILNLKEICSFSDYFIICTANSYKQAQAISQTIETSLKKLKLYPKGIEGFPLCEWILMDYFDFIVHIFNPEAREHYSLEKLWGDGIDETAKFKKK